MKFSIRMLLAVTLLIALVIVLVRAYSSLAYEDAKLQQTIAQTETLKARLSVYSLSFEQVQQYQADELKVASAIHDRAVSHFRDLQEQYRVIKPKDDDTFSCRLVPELDSDDPGYSRVTYRLHVPKNRKVWLKSCVTRPGVYGYHLRSTKDFPEVLRVASISPAGPFETQLEPGFHTLTLRYSRSDQADGLVSLLLDEAILYQASLSSESFRYSGASYTSPRTQYDLGKDQLLPWLVSLRLKKEVPGQTSEDVESTHFWLDDKSSAYEPFPSSVDSE
ncbi:hypothetical protein [Stieleria varia]|uniref:Uncharacterized protein n=1 Tax=Stieleria varia TaxID=2528005 RepID=A0A5C6B4Q5_9BACT|nr:hypothetical protein [Stieleria varia]TWU06461.1 hypothetical protein Pla52n_21820 [Stieleria varia]